MESVLREVFSSNFMSTMHGRCIPLTRKYEYAQLCALAQSERGLGIVDYSRQSGVSVQHDLRV